MQSLYHDWMLDLQRHHCITVDNMYLDCLLNGLSGVNLLSVIVLLCWLGEQRQH